MSYLIENSKQLKNACRWFIIPMINTYFVDELMEIQELYIRAEENGIFENIKYIKKNIDYFECYEYAYFLINSYIKDSNSYNVKYFFDNYGIDSETFNYCVKVIEELDVDLFNKYKEKYKSDMQIRYNIKIQQFKEIASGIKTGKTSAGKEFDILEFYRLVPFKSNLGSKYDFHEMFKINSNLRYHNSFIQRISSYLREVLPQDYYTIMNYINSNKIMDGANTSVSIEMLNDGITIIGDREITNEDNELIFNYIIQNHLPRIHGVYKEVRKRYLNGDITKEEIVNEKQKMVKKIKTYIINSDTKKDA